MIGYYVAPAANVQPGCGDPAADNFDLCALPTPDLCTYPADDCSDPLACNFTAGSKGTEDCVYFDSGNFTLSENDFIDLYDFEGCETSYDACSQPFALDLCEYAPAGTLSGDTIVMNGGTYAFSYQGQTSSTLNFYSPCGDLTVDGNTATLTVSSETDCERCVEETTETGCPGVLCQNLIAPNDGAKQRLSVIR